METLNDKLTEKAKKECTKLYYEKIQIFIKDFMHIFNVSDEMMKKDPLLHHIWNMQYCSDNATKILEIIIPTYVDNYLNSFLIKIEEMQEMLKTHNHD